MVNISDFNLLKNKDFICMMILPFIIFSMPSTSYQFATAIVLVFIATFALFYSSCLSKDKNVNIKQSSKLSLPVVGMALVYAILIFFSGALMSFPLTKIVGLLLKTYIGCIIAGIALFLTLLSTKTLAGDIICV